MNEKLHIKSNEVLEKVNFLSEAAIQCSFNPNLIELSQYLGSEADFSSKRTNLRKKPKNLFCKKCHIPLISPLNSIIIPGIEYNLYKCNFCGNSQKLYHKKKNSQSEIQHLKILYEVKKGIGTIKK